MRREYHAGLTSIKERHRFPNEQEALIFKNSMWT